MLLPYLPRAQSSQRQKEFLPDLPFEIISKYLFFFLFFTPITTKISLANELSGTKIDSKNGIQAYSEVQPFGRHRWCDEHYEKILHECIRSQERNGDIFKAKEVKKKTKAKGRVVFNA